MDFKFFAGRRLIFLLFIFLSVVSCNFASPTESNSGSKQYANSLYLTGSFDGSRSFRMWFETLNLAREVTKKSGNPTTFTYFINGIYYDHTNPKNCGFGQSYSRDETLTRWAITQQAVNEGHEIGNHSYHHGVPLGSGCSYYEVDAYSRYFWENDFRAMHNLVENNLFEAKIKANGDPIFPLWQISPADRSSGSACNTDADCQSGKCLVLNKTQAVCTQFCNAASSCPSTMSCGAKNWTAQSDMCVPRPKFPIADEDGTLLFDESGKANPTAIANGKLKPYKMKGMRAPFLQTHNLFPVQSAFHYSYDASQAYLYIPQPFYLPGTHILEFPVARLDKQEINLPKFPRWPLPFNTQYQEQGFTEEDMRQHYRESILWAYQSEKTNHWNISSHFSPWENNEVVFYNVFKEIIFWAASGCEGRCPNIKLLNFGKLADLLQTNDSSNDVVTTNSCDVFKTSAEKRCQDIISGINTCVNGSAALTICNSGPKGLKVFTPEGIRVSDPSPLYKNVLCQDSCDGQNKGVNDGCLNLVLKECP